jgi:hypothetical protein
LLALQITLNLLHDHPHDVSVMAVMTGCEPSAILLHGAALTRPQTSSR